MKDESVRAQIHQAVDRHAEHMRPDPSLAQRIMDQERTGGPAMKKKLSVGLVLAIILILFTVTALAAVLLGGREFVERIVAPRAAENDSLSFTGEEIDEILRIAAENGLVFSEQDLYILTHPEDTGYFKEELMRRFVKTEYGLYPDAWPIEVQHWYEEILEACGLDDGVIRNVLPEGDEYSQERILNIACDFIHEKYDPDAALDDPDRYTRFLTYRESRLSEELSSRQWSLTYEARDLYGTDYHLILDPAGHIRDEYSVEGILGASWEAHGQFMMDRFIRVYGDRYGSVNWNSGILLEYQKAMRHRLAMNGPEHFLSEEYPILKMTYLLPDEALLSRDEAVEKAKEACGNPDCETLYGNSAVAVCMENPEHQPVWKVTLRLRGGGYVFAQLDARTGEALFIDTDRADTYRLWRQYVTEEYWQREKPVPNWQKESTDRIAGTPRPADEGPSGRRLPAFWGDTELAPAWYWERLNAAGYDGGEEAFYEAMTAQYGYDSCFWPLEAQAIMILTQLGDDPEWNTVDLPGLPSEDDLSREEALSIAKAAFKEEYGEELPGLDVSVLKGAFSFRFDYMLEGHDAWQVNLYQPDGVRIGSVWLESKLGEVFELECFDSLHGGLRAREVSFNGPIATPAPLPDGKPWMWGMSFAPKEFWDRLEKAMDTYGVTAENFGQKEREWSFLYGDIMFAPYECQVISVMLASTQADEFTGEKPYYLTFPREGGITPERAAEIAVKALHEAGDPGVGADYINGLKINATLVVNGTIDGLYMTEEPTWSVFFYAWDDTYGYYAQRAAVYLTEDGEILFTGLDLSSNG